MAEEQTSAVIYWHLVSPHAAIRLKYGKKNAGDMKPDSTEDGAVTSETTGLFCAAITVFPCMDIASGLSDSIICIWIFESIK